MSGIPTFEEQVNTVVSQMTTDDSGKTIIPEGIEVPAEVLYAAKLEKRHRDTQAAYTKSRQELKRLSKENEVLAQSWEQDATKHLPDDEKARLEELKVQDPEKWRTEIAALEEAQKTKFQARRQEVSKKASAEVELATRQELLDEYNANNPDRPLTDEVIENDIPPRLTKQLEKGEITFKEFLDKCDKYITAPKKIATGDTPDEEPDFAESRGGAAPTKTAQSVQDQSDYSNEIF